MKKMILGLFVLSSLLQLRAENWLENGDFSSGTDHWRGDGRTPADMAPDDPFAKPDPLTSHGLIIPLKDMDWTKITQDFRTKAANLILTVTYILSPNLAFSAKDEDYTNIPEHIDNHLYRPFNLDKNQFMVLFTDFGNAAHGIYYKLDSKFGSSDPQTMRLRVMGLSPLEHEVVTLAFPPGHGTVTLLKISLDSMESGATSPLDTPNP